jgi:hypothetical protein
MYLNNVTSTDFGGGGAATHTQPPTDTVLSGNCTEVMRRLDAESVDFILTDPPYLAGYRSRDGRTLLNDGDDRWLKPAFSEAYRVLGRVRFCVSFYGWPMRTSSWPLGALLAFGSSDTSCSVRRMPRLYGCCGISTNWRTCWRKVPRNSLHVRFPMSSNSAIPETACIPPRNWSPRSCR